MDRNMTMSTLSYGIKHPQDLLKKLDYDWNAVEESLGKLKNNEDSFDYKILSYNVFNFIITTAVLREWVLKYYKDKICDNLKKAMEPDFKHVEGFPIETVSWIKDRSEITNPDYDLREQIQNCLAICRYACNASKHFYWQSKSNISAIDSSPEIKDWYQFFFTELDPGIYFEHNDIYYSIVQIRSILRQFYQGLIPYLENK